MKKCGVCGLEKKPEELGEDGCCNDIQACYEEFRFQDLASEANKEAGSH